MACKKTQERITDEILFYIQTFQHMPYKSLSFKGILELFLIRDNDVRMQQVFRNIWNELAISNVFLCAWLCVWMSERVCISVCHRSDCWCKLCNVLWPMRTLTTHSILRQMEPNGKFREQYWLWHNTNTKTIFTYKHTHTHVTHSLDVLHRMQYQPLTLICNIFIILTTTLEIRLWVCVWVYRFGCAWVNCWRGYCVKYQL